MEITKVYPLDAVYDTLEDVPEDVSWGTFLLKFFVGWGSIFFSMSADLHNHQIFRLKQINAMQELLIGR